STNLSEWQQSTNGLPPYTFLAGLFFGSNRFIAHGPNGLILSSINGRNWEPTRLGSTTFAYGAYGGRFFFRVRARGVLSYQLAYSTDGIGWTAEGMDAPNGLWFGLCYGDGRFVGVDDGQVLCSINGMSWSTCGGSFPAARLKAYGLGQYVALGDMGRIYTS